VSVETETDRAEKRLSMQIFGALTPRRLERGPASAIESEKTKRANSKARIVDRHLMPERMLGQGPQREGGSVWRR